MCVTRGRQRRLLAEDPVSGMTTTSFSMATPSSKSLRFQWSPPLLYRHPVRTPFSLHSPRGTAFVFYSFRQNIFDFLLTPSSRARQLLNQMSESSKANYHAHTLSFASYTAFPSARRWRRQTTTSFHRFVPRPLRRELSYRAMITQRWKTTPTPTPRPRMVAKKPMRATRSGPLSLIKNMSPH
jgi:hypothetical protein